MAVNSLKYSSETQGPINCKKHVVAVNVKCLYKYNSNCICVWVYGLFEVRGALAER